MNFFLCLTLIGTAAPCALAVDYGTFMNKKVKEVLGNKAKGYTFSTYPVSNYGLATAYEGKVNAAKQICATWDCLGIKSDEKVAALSSEHKMRLVVDGVQYASIGDGAPIKLSETEKKSLAINAILPKLLRALSLSADFARTTEIETDLALGPATIRTLRRQEMMALLASPKAHPLQKAVWEKPKPELVVVYSDIIFTSMALMLKIKPETRAEVRAKLTGALDGKVGKVVGSDASLGFTLDNAGAGTYSISITNPLIVAVYTKRQPASRILGPERGWREYKDAPLGSSNKIIEQKVDLPELR